MKLHELKLSKRFLYAILIFIYFAGIYVGYQKGDKFLSVTPDIADLFFIFSLSVTCIIGTITLFWLIGKVINGIIALGEWLDSFE